MRVMLDTNILVSDAPILYTAIIEGVDVLIT